MSSRTRYVVVETLFSVVINTALSVAFVFMVFHGRAQIAITGPHGVVLDMAPQTFMVVGMSCLVPALLTRRRLRLAALPWHSGNTQTGGSRVWLRAVFLALVATTLVVAVSWATLPHLFPVGVRFQALLIGKALVGMGLAAMVTPWAIASVLE